MSVRRLAAVVLVLLLAAPMATLAGAAPQAPPVPALLVDVDPASGCVLAYEYPQLQGSIVPLTGVTRSRLFFHSALGPDFYYVEAVLEGGRYVARLPRPRPEAGPIVYYLEATRSDFSQGRSGEGNAIVVRKIEDCPASRKAAPVAPGGPVSVFDVAGNPSFPAGFDGIAGAAAAGAGGAAGVGVAAGAGGGFLTSNVGIMTLAAVAVGITTVVILTNNGPQSPSR